MADGGGISASADFKYAALEDPTTPGHDANNATTLLRKKKSTETKKEKKKKEPPYSLRNEVSYFFSKGVPLGLSAFLEWGAPPIFSMVIAGHTEHSVHLQSSLGYARVFYNITSLMTMIAFCQYFITVLPGAIGAGRRDRVPTYLWRSVLICTLLALPIYALQFFSDPVLHAFGVTADIAHDVGRYTRLMIPASWMLMLEIHLESCFVNFGYAKSATFNSFVTGLGVDACCTWFFVYKWAWGIEGVALVQCAVKGARICVWFCLMCSFGLCEDIFGSRCCCCCCGGRSRSRRGRRRCLEADEAELDEDEDTEENDQPPAESLFSWKELRVFCGIVVPSCAAFFSGWFIFELQILALAHIAKIPPAALAAGAIWVQFESTFAAIQYGWLTVTRMRTLVLLGARDPDAPKSFTILCVCSFVFIAVQNVPMAIWSTGLGSLVSNNGDVRRWFDRIVWVLILHTQTRICSINSGTLFIPTGRAILKVLTNFVSFYLVACPISGVCALTDVCTTSIPVKMAFCLGASSIAQTCISVFNFCYLVRTDWGGMSDAVVARANTDRQGAMERVGDGGDADDDEETARREA